MTSLERVREALSDEDRFLILRVDALADLDTHEKEDAERVEELARRQKKLAEYEEEVFRLREENDAFKRADHMTRQENARLREESGTLQKRLRKTIYQRDTLLAALRRVEAALSDWLTGRPQHISELLAHELADIRAAISEVEGEKE